MISESQNSLPVMHMKSVFIYHVLPATYSYSFGFKTHLAIQSKNFYWCMELNFAMCNYMTCVSNYTKEPPVLKYDTCSKMSSFCELQTIVIDLE